MAVSIGLELQVGTLVVRYAHMAKSACPKRLLPRVISAMPEIARPLSKCELSYFPVAGLMELEDSPWVASNIAAVGPGTKTKDVEAYETIRKIALNTLEIHEFA